MLASTRLAGEGLTLTEANHIIFINKWWNPSTNLQAQERIARIGQKKTCFIYSFMLKGTIEERLEAVLRRKQEAIDAIMLGISEHERDFFR